MPASDGPHGRDRSAAPATSTLVPLGAAPPALEGAAPAPSCSTRSCARAIARPRLAPPRARLGPQVRTLPARDGPGRRAQAQPTPLLPATLRTRNRRRQSRPPSAHRELDPRFRALPYPPPSVSVTTLAVMGPASAGTRGGPAGMPSTRSWMCSTMASCTGRGATRSHSGR